jgi:hypothetical protein
MVRVNAGVDAKGRSIRPKFDPLVSLNTTEQRIVLEWLARHRPDLLVTDRRSA